MTKGRRQRLLNLIYFVDAEKTHTVVLKMRQVYILIGVMITLLCWSLLSTGIIYFNIAENNSLRTHLRSMLATVFDYQIRYDQVYEKTYPEGKQASVVAAKEAPAAPEPPKAAAPIPEPPTAEHSGQASATVDAKLLVSIEQTHVDVMDQQINLRFSIINNNIKDKADGYVWGIARYEGDAGKKLYVGAPSSIAVDEKGEAKNPKRSYSYSIRHQKTKTMVFVPPKDKGTFSEIKVYVMDRSGQQSSVTVPVQANPTSERGAMRTHKRTKKVARAN